jgi:selenocysteine lyase/cysteine desulfurase
MGVDLIRIDRDEDYRRSLFPVAGHRIFMAHAGVSPLPRAGAELMSRFIDQACRDHQESGFIPSVIERARTSAARLLGCRPGEISLLGPTSLGLSLVAAGIDWRKGDEVVCYGDDYPANVYPWRALTKHGVKIVLLAPREPGRITWETVAKALTPQTRLVALASAHYLSGWRIDVDRIGRNLGERGVLFCLDGIQTAGAFPLSLEHVDFMSADSHKWLLGPLGAGIFYVRRERARELEPMLLGSWNVRSPDFIAQESIEFEEGGRRYEPGALNVPGIAGMTGALELINETGVDAIASRIAAIRSFIEREALRRGYRSLTEEAAGQGEVSGILSLRSDGEDADSVLQRFRDSRISVSLRRSRAGEAWIRVSPHFYNTMAEAELLLECL